MTDKPHPPCICCGRIFETFYGPNQPGDGLGFYSLGAYGSTVFDPMDGSSIAINVCDPCIQKATSRGLVLFYDPPELPRLPATAKARVWSGE